MVNQNAKIRNVLSAILIIAFGVLLTPSNTANSKPKDGAFSAGTTAHCSVSQSSASPQIDDVLATNLHHPSNEYADYRNLVDVQSKLSSNASQEIDEVKPFDCLAAEVADSYCASIRNHNDVILVTTSSLYAPSAVKSIHPQYVITPAFPEVGSTINGNTTVEVYAPGMKNLVAHIWHQPDADHPGANGYDAYFTGITPDLMTGLAQVKFDANLFPHGPLVVVINGWDSAAGDPNYSHSDNTWIQFYNGGGVVWNKGIPAPPPQAAGMSVVYQDDFTSALSISRTGAGTTYTSLKPDNYPNGSEFGDAIFADPATPYNPFAIIGNDYLRIRISKVPPGYSDPWGRTYFGGMLSSARVDGTGIAATNGYFEARMMLPPGNGAWSAFWLLSKNSIGASRLSTTAEIDIVETYGANPQGACQNEHSWATKPEIHQGNCSNGNYAFSDGISTWHIYGVKITPATTYYYIDNVQVWSHPTLPQERSPMFFLIDAALGSGFPVDLTKYGGQVDLFVDYVRVFQ